MQPQAGILDLLRRQGEQALKRSRRAVIIQPGAVGDCILTLPLAAFIKKRLELGSVDLIGRTDYTGYFPGRTCVDTIRAIDCLEIHRLFCDPADFDLTPRDSLIETFAGYSWILSFLAAPQSCFEQNLIYTANCSQSAEVLIFPQQSPQTRHHVAAHHITHLCSNWRLKTPAARDLLPLQPLIKPTRSDKRLGAEIARRVGAKADKPLVVLCPGSGRPDKCWHLANFLAVAEKLKSKHAQPLFLLGPAEIERFPRPSLTDISTTAPSLTDLSLTEVLQVLSCADAFVGNDSGITHLAAALGLHTIALFGPTDPQVWRPLGPAVCVLEDKSAAFDSQPSQELQQRVLRELQKRCA
jgi:heptosyltransferase-3